MAARAIHRKIRSFDWLTLIPVVLLSILSLLFVFSTTYRLEAPFSLFFKKQCIGFALGYLLCVLVASIDYRRLQRWGYFLYYVTLILLIFTLVKGSIGLGGQRWISLGFFKFQPSELIKLFFPAFFTYSLQQRIDGELNSHLSSRTALPILGMLGFSLLCILKQPDLGTAIVIGLSSLILLRKAGLSKTFFLAMGAFAIVGAPLLWNCLKEYQKRRVMVFLGYGEVRKERYQIEQSCIALGSGGILGKGFLCGTQNTLQFVPESRTDFIFSIVGEEWGFIGALGVITLYLILFLRWISCIQTIEEPLVQLLALGLITPIIVSALINMGMVMWLLPVVGVPLPLMSYGITHTWTTLMSIGFFSSIIRSCGE